MTAENTRSTPQAKTKLFVAAGVVFEGNAKHAGPQDEYAVIGGEFRGNLDWAGIVYVLAGAALFVTGHVRCRDMVVAGRVVGMAPDSIVDAGRLRLTSTAEVEVASLRVPPGFLTQDRGSVLSAALRMVNDEPQAAAPRSSARPMLIVSNSSPSTSATAATAPHTGTEA